MSSLARCRVPERPQHVAGPQERESGAVAVGQLVGADLREHRLGLFAASQPRQCVRPNEVRFRPRSGVDRRFRQSIREGQVRQPDGTVRCPDEQVGVGREVGVETQRRAAHDDSYVVVVGRMRRVRRRPVREAVVAGCVAPACGAPLP